MFKIIILVLMLTGCATSQVAIKQDQLATVQDVAKAKILPNLELPLPLNLDKYKLDVSKVKQVTVDNEIYIAIPEKDTINQQEFLLVLKSRILELQTIIITAKKLM